MIKEMRKAREERNLARSGDSSSISVPQKK